VFTRKANTDVSYHGERAQAARPARPDLSAVRHAQRPYRQRGAGHGRRPQSFEFQRLHGMGEALHDIVREAHGTRCRIYAPVGAHRDLLAYLVRRLLENGANSSFVNQIVDKDLAPEAIAADPIAAVEALGRVANPGIPKPADIFAPRRNARGWHVNEPASIAPLIEAREAWRRARVDRRARRCPARSQGQKPRPVTNPADPTDVVGQVAEAVRRRGRGGARRGAAAFPRLVGDRAGRAGGDAAPGRRSLRGECRGTDALATREAGKTLADAISELREAVDFLRYYADEAEAEATGAGRGVIVCISPWNFPLAIFTGQVAAALAAGNAVIAKPAEQTPLIAARAVELMHAAGIPGDVLHFLPGDGPTVGAPLTAAPGIAGVCFTGSTEVAQRSTGRWPRTRRPTRC
jgi:RHH-type transcriptional regulator, proline utilization regulon repressor / proline dehydrogenase / delta 1-pyrroline-5-carboxylate dehydrogenase